MTPVRVHVRREARRVVRVSPAVKQAIDRLLRGEEIDVTSIGIDAALVVARVGREVQAGNVTLVADGDETAETHIPPQLPPCRTS